MAKDESYPKSWKAISLAELVEIVSGQTPKEIEKFHSEGGTVPWFRIADMNKLTNQEWLTDASIRLTEEAIRHLGLHIRPPGTIVFPKRGGAIATNKKRLLSLASAYDLNIMGIIAGEDIRPYIWWWFHTVDLGQLNTGTTVPQINHGDIASLYIPVPPVNEQRRIVAKIEALFKRSRRAKEALDAIPPLLDKLRKSILAAAFRGDLTADWRAKHPDVEPASALLDRIRAERRRRWEEAELAKMAAKGTPPKDNKWKAKYEEPEPVDTSPLPELPPGWCESSLESLCDPVRGIPYGIVLTGKDIPSGTPTIRGGDIKNFTIDISRLKQVDPTVSESYRRTLLQGGEVLLSIRGSIGASTVASADMKGMNISREIAMIPVLPPLHPQFVMYFLASPVGQQLLIKHVKGVAQLGINLSDLRSLNVPLPSFEEQQQLVSLIEKALSKIEILEERCLASSKRIVNAESSILAKAFRGELVPQDPNDEPASELLKRIRAERQAGNESDNTKRKRRT